MTPERMAALVQACEAQDDTAMLRALRELIPDWRPTAPGPIESAPVPAPVPAPVQAPIPELAPAAARTEP
jgi:hypothetical protein